LRTGVDTETEALRQAGVDERAGLLRQIEEGDRLVREAQTAAIGDLTDRQGSLIGDLQSRIGTLSTDLTDINSVIEQNFTDLVARQEESASSLSAIQEAAQTATDQELGILGQQAERVQDEIGGLGQQLESLSGTQNEIDSLNQQLESLYTDVESGNAAQSETIRSETAQLISGLEQQIGGLADNLGALPIESIQAQLATVNDQTAQFKQAVDSAAGERADLSARLEALQASGLTQEDLSSLSQNIAGQRQADIAAALDPIAQQRQTAITSAIDPIQQQIEALRGEIPQQQNIDVEALRQQITDQVMSQLPQQQTTAPAETTTPPITVEPEGDASAAAMNLSDGQADALGLFDDPAPTGGSLRARGQLGYQRRDQFDPRGQQQFNQTPGVRDTVAVPTMRSNQMTGRVGQFIPDTQDIMRGINVRGIGL
jgi:predicted  nucleic acid-binding Zn-ribbon protein